MDKEKRKVSLKKQGKPSLDPKKNRKNMKNNKTSEKT